MEARCSSPLFVDAKDLEAVVRRIGREEELAARRQRQGADLAALEEREAPRLGRPGRLEVGQAGSGPGGPAGIAAARHARTDNGAIRDETERRARYGIAIEPPDRRRIRCLLDLKGKGRFSLRRSKNSELSESIVAAPPLGHARRPLSARRGRRWGGFTISSGSCCRGCRCWSGRPWGRVAVGTVGEGPRLIPASRHGPQILQAPQGLDVQLQLFAEVLFHFSLLFARVGFSRLQKSFTKWNRGNGASAVEVRLSVTTTA